MLSKLIGYEYRATRRIFFPAYAAMLILALINSIGFTLPEYMSEHTSILFSVLFTLFIVSIAAAYVLSFAYTVYRFHKNLLGDEGYLMFTLPATPAQLIWAKCIVSSIWIVLTTIVCALSLILFTAPYTIMDLPFSDFSMIWFQLRYGISVMMHDFGIGVLFVPLEGIVLGICATLSACMMIYACLSIGSLSNKHRLGFAFLTYIGLNTMQQILFSALTNVLDSLFPNVMPGIANTDFSYIHFFLLGNTVWMLILLVLYFIVTNHILSKNLNLL